MAEYEVATTAPPASTAQRFRGVVAVRSVVLVEAGLFAVVAPLLPVFIHIGRMNPSEAGLLVGAYPGGVLIGTPAAMWYMSRYGIRRGCIVGLSLLAVATLAFAWSGDTAELDGARLVQGIGGQFAWTSSIAWLTVTSSRDAKGVAVGGAVSAALLGMVVGPLLGGTASLVGRGFVFSLIAGTLLLILLCIPRTSPGEGTGDPIGVAVVAIFRGTGPRLGSLALAVVGFGGGTLATLAPLLLARRGASAAEIAVVFATSYLIGSRASLWVGRMADRLGYARLSGLGFILAGLLIPAVSLAPSLPLATVAVAAAVSCAVTMWTPTAALISAGAVHTVSGQVGAGALGNGAWAVGAALGAAVAGRVTAAASLSASLAVAGGIFLIMAAAFNIVGPRATGGAR